MEAARALAVFLRKTLANRRERYLGFVSKPKTRRKFLETIYHDLEHDLDPARKVEGFSEEELQKAAYRFEPPDVFGEPMDSLKEVGEHDESFLVVSVDGKLAIHGPESYIDSRAYYRVVQ